MGIRMTERMMMTGWKDARASEKPWKRHQNSLSFIITLGGHQPSCGSSWVLKLCGTSQPYPNNAKEQLKNI
jgi:hypothetical protein